MKNADKPTFGFHERSDDNREGQTHYGLTKREYIAAMALQGLLAAGERYTQQKDFSANHAVEMADALLAELDTPQP